MYSCVSILQRKYKKTKRKEIFTNQQLFLVTDQVSNSMDELSSVIQSIIDSELDDLILDLVYEIHSSIKGIPEDQLEINHNGTRAKTFSIPFSQCQKTAIEKQTCACPQCGQSNIVAIRFAYHLAKCLGERKSKKEYFFISGFLLLLRIKEKNIKKHFKKFFKVLVDVHLVKQNIELLIKL